jgi:hypothetical protein
LAGAGRLLLGDPRQACQIGFDPLVKYGELGLIGVIQAQRLLQSKQMLFAIIAYQAFGKSLCAAFTAGVTMLGKYLWVTLTGQDRADDRHPSQAGDIRDDVMQQEVHLLEGLSACAGCAYSRRE